MYYHPYGGSTDLHLKQHWKFLLSEFWLYLFFFFFGGQWNIFCYLNKYLQKIIFLMSGLMYQCNNSLEEIVLSSVCFIVWSTNCSNHLTDFSKKNNFKITVVSYLFPKKCFLIVHLTVSCLSPKIRMHYFWGFTC